MSSKNVNAWEYHEPIVEDAELGDVETKTDTDENIAQGIPRVGAA